MFYSEMGQKKGLIICIVVSHDHKRVILWGPVRPRIKTWLCINVLVVIVGLKT